MALKITINGKTQSLAVWCRDFNQNYRTVLYRLNHKWSIEQALGLSPPPPRKRKPQKSIIERIYERVICDIKTQCWNWTGHLVRGYGRIGINDKEFYVHRIVYQELYGSIPENKPCILHKCDNTKCCNPKHLYAGTNQNNSSDMTKRKRSAIGEKNGCAKLTEKQVLEIRASKETQAVLAKRFNISQTHIHKIKNRKKWKHI